MATSFNPEIARQLHTELMKLRDDIVTFEASKASELVLVSPEKLNDIRNLVHYIAFRQHDVSDIRQTLRLLGLNSLEQIDTDVLGQLNTVIRAMEQLFPELPKTDFDEPASNLPDSGSLTDFSELSVAKMRTLPSDSAFNYQISLNLLKEGTQLVRIRARENDPDKMLKMIHNLHRAATEQKIKCPVVIDLEDSLVRVGEFEHFSPALKIDPERNEKGQVIQKAVVYFVLHDSKQSHQALEVPIECPGYRQLKSNDVIYLRDSAERSRRMIISEVGKGFIKAETDKTVYLDKGIRIMFLRKGEIIDHATIGKIPSKEIQVTVHNGDTISILSPGTLGQPPVLNSKGELLHPARISCTSAELFNVVKAGQRIFFGKKKVEGIITNVAHSQLQVEITRANPSGNSLFRGKRIYLPDSLNWRKELTENDFQNIKLAVDHGGMVCVSVENDLKQLQDYLNSNSFLLKGLVLKIGNIGGLEILQEQLLEGLKINLSGVWIRQKEIAVGKSSVQTDEAVAEIARWCKAARIRVIRN